MSTENTDVKAGIEDGAATAAKGKAPAGAPPLSREETLALLRRNLKVLLFHLASHSEAPGRELEGMLQEVIGELYLEAQEALATRRSRLKLVKV